MPTRISESTFNNIMNQVTDESINTGLVFDTNCQKITNIYNGPGCNWTNVKYTSDITCPMEYSGGDKKSAESIVNDKKKEMADHASHSVAHSGGFVLFPGNTLAENVASATLTATDKITNALFDECTTSSNLVNTFYCKNSTLDNVMIEQDQGTEIVQNCMANRSDNNVVYQGLKSDIAQTEVNSTPSSLYIWEGIILFISSILIIASIVVGEKISWKLSLVFIIIIIIMTMIALHYVIKKYGKTQIIQWCPDCTIYTNEKDCTNSMCYWDSDTNKCRCDGTKTDCSTQCPMFYSESDCKKNYCGWDSQNNVCTGKIDYCKSPN